MDKELHLFVKVPPLYDKEKGQIDVSKAALVEIDGPHLKQINKTQYDRVLLFGQMCRRKCRLRLFHHPGDPNIDGLGAVTGTALTQEDRDLAITAVEEYNKVNQKTNLKLMDLMKVNYSMSGGVFHYLTFSALDDSNGEIKTYQAALLDHFNGQLLVLFRDLVDDQILAILSVKGAEEDLATLPYDRVREDIIDDDDE